MSMENRKRPAPSSSSGSSCFWSSSLGRQPARVLIVEALPPWWSQTSPVLCDALDNFFSLACSLDGPCRIPLLSLYAISRQQECLLPFVQVRGNLARLHSCVEELRSLPGEGCVKEAARGGELLRQAVLDSLQQFKQYIRHTSASNQGQNNNNTSVEVTMVTSYPGQGIVRLLEMGLKDIDVVSLKRLLVVQMGTGGDGGQEVSSPEDTHNNNEESLMLGTEVDLQQVENSVFAMESVFKSWLQQQGGDREHIHLLLPSPTDSPTPVCVKCDMQERLISPALLPLTPNLGAKTESASDFLPVTKGSSNQSPAPQRLKVIMSLRADAVCESVLYGLPLLLRPTTCWQLDWEEMETNHNLFHALCHTLRSRDLFLLLQVEPIQRSTAGVFSHYILQPSPSLTFLLKPVASRELLLPCSLPVPAQDPTPDALLTVQTCLSQLSEEFVFNPLSLSTNLYQHLRSRGLLSQPRFPYRVQPAAVLRELAHPSEGTKSTGSRQPRQPQNLTRHVGSSSKIRATVAPIPSTSLHSSSSVMGPPSSRASRPALKLLSSRSSGRWASAYSQKEEEDDDDGPLEIE